MASHRLDDATIQQMARQFLLAFQHGSTHKLQSIFDCLGLHPYNHASFVHELFVVTETIEDGGYQEYWLLAERLLPKQVDFK